MEPHSVNEKILQFEAESSVLEDIHELNVDAISEVGAELRNKYDIEGLPSIFTELEEEHLSQLSRLSATDMQADIYNYYKSNPEHDTEYHSAAARVLERQNLSDQQQETVVSELSMKKSEKVVADFKVGVAKQLKDSGIAEDLFPKFWAWRIGTNKPDSSPVLVHGEGGDYIKLDDFVTGDAVKLFLEYIKDMAEKKDSEKADEVVEENLESTTEDTAQQRETYSKEDVQQILGSEEIDERLDNIFKEL